MPHKTKGVTEMCSQLSWSLSFIEACVLLLNYQKVAQRNVKASNLICY